MKKPHSNISYCSNIIWILILKISNPGKNAKSLVFELLRKKPYDEINLYF